MVVQVRTTKSQEAERSTMAEANALIEQLRRANRRWKALALAACFALALAAIGWSVSTYWQRLRVERALADANRLLSVAAEKQAAQPR